jgi:hypothetical protein
LVVGNVHLIYGNITLIVGNISLIAGCIDPLVDNPVTHLKAFSLAALLLLVPHHNDLKSQKSNTPPATPSLFICISPL